MKIHKHISLEKDFQKLVDWVSNKPTEEELIKKCVALNISLGDLERALLNYFQEE